MIYLLFILCLVCITCTVHVEGSADESASRKTLYETQAKKLLGFFDKYAWQEEYNSYASDIARDGSLNSPYRQVVALSRMVIANSIAPIALKNLKRADRALGFLIDKMQKNDKYGPAYLSTVTGDGKLPPIEERRNYTFAFESAYPIGAIAQFCLHSNKHNYTSSLVAKVCTIKNLMAHVRAYEHRYMDANMIGTYYFYNFVKDDHTNDNGEVFKTYQASVYPLSSFVIPIVDYLTILERDPIKKAEAGNAIVDMMLFVLDIMYDVEDMVYEKIINKEKQWFGLLKERFDANMNVDESYVMSEAGHVTQLSWVLHALWERNLLSPGPAILASGMLADFLTRSYIAESGCLIDGVNRTSGAPMGDYGAWWVQLEAITAFDTFAHSNLTTLAQRDYFRQARNRVENCYFSYFVDKEFGGEFFSVNTKTLEVGDDTKGNAGKAAYHFFEAFSYVNRVN